MSKSNHYKPVSCDMHSELELSIMHAQQLQIQIVQNDKLLSLTIRPLDIISRKGKGEFLLAEDMSGQTVEFRLDNIHKFQAL